jgi:hypothetical protein
VRGERVSQGQLDDAGQLVSGLGVLAHLPVAGLGILGLELLVELGQGVGLAALLGLSLLGLRALGGSLLGVAVPS